MVERVERAWIRSPKSIKHKSVCRSANKFEVGSRTSWWGVRGESAEREEGERARGRQRERERERSVGEGPY